MLKKHTFIALTVSTAAERQFCLLMADESESTIPGDQLSKLIVVHIKSIVLLESTDTVRAEA